MGGGVTQALIPDSLALVPDIEALGGPGFNAPNQGRFLQRGSPESWLALVHCWAGDRGAGCGRD